LINQTRTELSDADRCWFNRPARRDLACCRRRSECFNGRAGGRAGCTSIESDEEEVEQQQRRRGDDAGSGSDSDASGSSCATPRRGSVTAASTSSYTHQWPQSYR
jgi:hypothetical protein